VTTARRTARAASGFLLPLAFLTAAAPRLARAQNPRPGAVRETARVSLVEVPVTVTGRDGKPVAGLKAPDFELEEDGRRQTILSVDVVDLARHPRGTDADDAPPLARRHFLFLFDFTFATPNEIARSREAAARFVAGGLSPDDLAAVATLSAERGARLELTFTSDRRQIVQAIQAVGLPGLVDRERDPLAFAFSLPGDPRLVIQEGYTPKQNVDANYAQKLIAAMGQRVADDYTVTRVQRHLSDMGSLATALDLVRGRKTVLYFSEGIDGRLVFGSLAHEKSVEQTAADNDAMMSGAAWTIDVDRRYANAPIERQLSETTELLRRADCVVYPIDIAGLRESADVSLGTSGRGEDFLFALAQGTGGELIQNGNDLGDQIARIAERTSLTYVLAYRPASESRDGAYHALRVRTRVKGARVSARAGYYERRSFGALSPLQRRLAAADILAHEIPVSDIAARALAAAEPGEKGPAGLAMVPVLVAVDGGSLLAGQKGNRLSTEIFAYATDAENGVRDFFAQTVALDLAVSRERLERGGLRFWGRLALPAGDYRIRILVRNAETGRMGLTITPVRVPDFSQRRAYIAPPLFLERPEAGLSIRSPSAARAELPGETGLRDSGGEPLVAAALPEMRAGTTAKLALLAYNFGDPAGTPWKVGAQVLSGEGRPLGPGEIEVLGKTPADNSGRQTLLLAFHPAALAPGRYALRVFVEDSSTGRAAQNTVPFVVR
jgi:VWFA-related protein